MCLNTWLLIYNMKRHKDLKTTQDVFKMMAIMIMSFTGTMVPFSIVYSSFYLRYEPLVIACT